MARQSLVASTVDRIFEDVLSGAIPAGSQLPPEGELAARCDVSRLTVREAVKVLQVQGVVRGVRGRRHQVVPVSEWTGIEMVLRAVVQEQGPARASIELIQVRRMIETGAAALAALHRSPAELAALEDHLAAMRAASAAGDVAAFVTADIAFHDVVFGASGNAFLRVLLDPLARVLQERRTETSAFAPVQEHAIAMHAEVLRAVASGSPEAARRAMDAHMDQTEADLRHYVLGEERSPSS